MRTHSRSEPKGNTEGDRLMGKNRTLELWYSFKGPEIQAMGSWKGGEVGKKQICRSDGQRVSRFDENDKLMDPRTWVNTPEAHVMGREPHRGTS